MPPAKPFSKQDLLRAMKYSKSIRGAARYLGCSYQHIKPYFKMYRLDDNDINSPSLFDVHYNQKGKGIAKFIPNTRKEPHVKNIFTENIGWESFTTDKIKIRGIAEGFLKEECYQCGFNERRITDYKIPLLLNFKDGNKCNYLLDNVNLLCYNCYFLLGGGSIGEEVFTENQIRQIESNQTVKEKSHNLEMDDDHYENMKALGLVD